MAIEGIEVGLRAADGVGRIRGVQPGDWSVRTLAGADVVEPDDADRILLRAGVPPAKRHAQKSTGAGSGSASASSWAPMPSFSLIFFSTSAATSGFSRMNLRAFSLPWPSWSPS
jgi:hypothetical protein